MQWFGLGLCVGIAVIAATEMIAAYSFIIFSENLRKCIEATQIAVIA